MKMKKTGKELVAWLCILTLLVGCFANWGMDSLESKAANTGYTELTFADFGFSTAVTNGWGMLNPITSWDNVAVSGSIILPATGSGKYIRIGTGGSSEWDTDGIEIYNDSGTHITMVNRNFGTFVSRDDGNTSKNYVSFNKKDFGMEDKESVAGVEIPIRITFEPVDNGTNMKITLTVNDMLTKWIKVTRTTKQNCKIWINGNDGITNALSSSGVQVISKEKTPDQKEYTELTFADFGFSTAVTNGWGMKNPITSWDNVAISGTIILPAVDSSKYVRIGTGGSGEWDTDGIEIYNDSGTHITMVNRNFGTFVSRDDGRTDRNYVSFNKKDFGMADKETIAGVEVPIRITFEPVDNGTNMKITLTVNDMLTKWIKVTRTEKQNCKIWVSGNDGITNALSSSGVQLISEEEKPDQKEYTELTFADFGFPTAVTNGWGNLSPITSWDNVAVSGTIILPAVDSSKYVRIGTGGSGEWDTDGIEIYNDSGTHITMVNRNFGTFVSRDDGRTDRNYVSFNKKDFGMADKDTIAGVEVPIRITFEPVDNGANMKITLTVNDMLTKWIKVTRAEKQKCKIWVSGNDGIANALSSSGVQIFSESVQTDKDTYISELESIQVTAVSQRADWVGIFEEGATAYTKETAKAWYNVADYNGTAYTIPAQAAGNYTVCLMMDESTVLLSKTITVTQNPYTEYTFRDFGLGDQSVTNNTVNSSALEGVNSWDKVAISGTIAMPGNNQEDHWIRLGGEGGITIRSAGGSIILECPNGAFGGAVATSGEAISYVYISACDSGENIGNQEIPIRITFDHIDDGDAKLKVTVTANNYATGWMTFKEQTGAQGFKLQVYAAANRTVTIKSTGGATPGPEPEQKEYTEYTFSDFGIVNQIVEAGAPARNVIQPFSSWEDVAISGTVMFPESADSYLRFGTSATGWTGLELRWAAGGGLVLVRSGFGNGVVSNGPLSISAKSLGYEDTIAGKYLDFRMTFEYADEGENILATLTVTGEDDATATAWMKVSRPETEHYGILIYGGGGNVSVASIGTTPAQPVKPEPIRDIPLKPVTSYKEVTFKDFLMKDGVIKGNATSGQVTTLEGRVFKGIITFPEKGGGYIRIGGTAKNEWYGIQVAGWSEGLRLFEAANGRQVWDISTETIGRNTLGEALELWLTFTYVDEHNVYVGVYVDGKFCGEKLFKNLVQPFESKLLVYSPQAEMKIASADTAWNKLLKSKVNFAYWGFTDNWKKELAKICK